MFDVVERVFEDITGCIVKDVVCSISINFEARTASVIINEDFVIDTLKNVYGLLFVKYSDYEKLINKLQRYYLEKIDKDAINNVFIDTRLLTSKDKYFEHFDSIKR